MTMSLCKPACARTTYLSILSSHRLLGHAKLPSAAVSTTPCRTAATAAAAVIRPQSSRRARHETSLAKAGADTPAESTSLEWIVQKHLQYLSDDPYKIAQHVRATIARGRFEEALLLTRKASKNANLTVSWNHLIEHLLGAQRLHTALKLYNEMKKRAQLPNAQTYTIIFNGCAMSDHPKLAVTEALRIYNTMLGSDRLKPNVAHLNAVIKVCARAGDLESLFTLLQDATGTRSPNTLTYTTILNALRVKEPPLLRPAANVADMTPVERLEAHRAKVDVAVQRGKRVWDEVVDRWRHGKVVIDEELVCAMGRLLLSGDATAQGEVLSLVEQTMGVPRLDGSSSAGVAHKTLSGAAQQAKPNSDGARAKPLSAQGYAKPGNNTLSMIMHVLGATKKTSLAPRYWDLFVTQLGVQPDSDNWFRLLLTLHMGKGSTKASKYLEQMPSRLIRPTTLRLVMQTCVADNLNMHAFENADRVLDVAMRTWHGKPDPETMRDYLQAATGNHHRFRRAAGDKDAKAATEALGKQLMRALDRLWEPMKEATGDFAPPKGAHSAASTLHPANAPTTAPPATGAWSNEVRELSAVARRMTAVMSKILRDNMAEAATLESLLQRHSTLKRYITAVTDRVGGMRQTVDKKASHELDR